MERLTGREKEVLGLVARGLSCRDIADALGIAEFTVRKHRANLCCKLDCHSAAQLAALAIRIHDSTPVDPSESVDYDVIERLRPRERQVIDLLAEGLTSKQIARVLGGISPRTVQKHRERAMHKLGVHDMSALMRIASALGKHKKPKS